MGDVRELFKQKEQDRLQEEVKQEEFGTKATSIRLDYWDVALADVLSDHLGMSRNELMKTVLSEGLKEAMIGVTESYQDPQNFQKEMSDRAWKIAEKMRQESLK